MKSLMLFLRELLVESGSWCGISTLRDYNNISKRVEHEGLSFLTISLPNFGKDLEKALDQGFVDHELFKGFAFTAGLPRLFGGFLDLVFDRGTGVLLDDPSIEAIQALRQLTLMFGKIKLACSDERNQAALMKYLECEKDVREFDKSFIGNRKESFERIGRLLFRDVYTEMDRKVYYGELIPKHGPGSTADMLMGNRKYYQSEWTSRLEPYFPAGEYLIPNWKHYHVLADVTYLEPGQERPVEVILVPKTLKTPRVIAKEPTCMQYTQQAILEPLVELLERDNLLSTFIGFTNQEPNQLMAREGSLYGDLATLDMSEASDRVSNQHVLSLLSNHPHFRGAVQACRSRTAVVSGFGVKRLAKFASMGSALCFPFEAMVFLTTIFVGIEKALNTQLTRKLIESFSGQVRIYGDDIIIPVEFVPFVVDELEAFGFKVNSGKSFWTGKFRESCGKEYYDGSDVSIVRVRSMLPALRTDDQEIISSVSLRNQLYLAGYWRTVKWLDSYIERFIPFPAVASTSPALGRLSVLGYSTERMSSSLQRPMVKAAVVKSKLPLNKADDYAALLKYFLKRSDLPVEDREHLDRSGRPVSVSITTRWTYSY